MCLCYAGFGQHGAHGCSGHGPHECTVSAYPYPIIKTQPNGEQITIKMFGNANTYYIETLDGYTITKDRNDGFYKYLVSDNDGDLLLTDIVAHNSKDRTQKELGLLNTIPKKMRVTGKALKQKQDLLKQGQNNSATCSSDFPSFGVRKALMLLVDFPDQPYTHSVNEVDDLMNQPGYNVNNQSGSFKDYYLDVSYNNLTINTDVKGWYTASQGKAAYGAVVYDPVTNDVISSDVDPRSLVRETVDAAEAAGVNFSEYDNDGNGEVDVVMIIHSGQGQEASGEGDDIWSHKWQLFDQSVTYDGVLVDKYMIQPETLQEYNGDVIITNIGVICHEFGHALGLPDLYGNVDADDNTIPLVPGIGKWGIMASGSWNNFGRTPSQMCAWSKAQLGWVTPTLITSTQSISNMSTIDVSTDCYRLNTPNGNEYFLISARQQSGWDTYIPGEGMAIWHIDDTQNGNNTYRPAPYTPEVYLEQADGLNELLYNINNAGDLFPGTSNNTYFTDTTIPNANNYDGNTTGNYVSNITTTGTAPNLTAGFYVNAAYACPDVDNDGICAAIDCDDTDANIPAEPGTTCEDGNPSTLNDLIQCDGCTCKGTPTSSLGYCAPDISGNTSYISGVYLQGGGISNSSGDNGGYRDFALDVAPGNVTKAETYTLDLHKISPPSDVFYWKVWIDYDGNGVFDDQTEVALSQIAVSNDIFSGSITIPDNAVVGATAMRVYLKKYQGELPTPCESNDASQEVEDYLININNCVNADNDGACAVNDCDDNDPALPIPPGTPCDDDSSVTIDDVIQEDGCTCAGTPISVMGYCVPDISSTPENYISGVYLQGGGISNSSGNEGGYWDFSTEVASGYVAKSATYTLDLHKTSNPGDNFYWKVWIDYNQDGDFEDASEEVLSQVAVSNDIFSGSIAIPANALNGATAMRVYLKKYQAAAPIPCGNDDNVEGDVEDYRITISANGCTDADNDGVCAGADCDDNNANLPATPGTPCNDDNSSTDNDVILADGCTCEGTIPTCTDADNDGVCAADDCNDNNADLPATPGTPCDDGDFNTTNDVILADGCTCQGTVTPPSSSEYCIPNVTSSTDNFISGIVIPNEISVGSGNDGGYKDFTSEVAPANLLPGTTYNLTLYKMLNNNANVYWKVWIDYNQDGVFEDNINTELIVSDWPVSTNIFSNNFTVPAGTPNGPTRMRVYLKEYIGQPPVPCGNNDNVAADVEDYAIIIGDGCSLFLEVSGTINPGTFEVADYIESDGQVLSNNTVTFQAGNLVHLLPGFIATAGTDAQFHALIDDCPVSAPKQEIESTEQVNIRNYPNPFTGQTTIEFTLTEDSPVTLWVTDAMGRKVAVLKDGESTFAGTHEVYFDGSNHSAGMYYYTIQAGEYTGTQKMILLR